jgi:hypothetical protein
MFRLTIFIASLLCVVMALGAGCAELQSMGATNTLVNLLASQLGVTQNQATGGAGSVLSLAQGKLPPMDFATLTRLIPGSDSLMKSAKDLGAVTGPITDKTGLESAFSRLGMGADMVPKFVQTMGDFVGKTGGEPAKNLLTSLLR